MISKIKEKRFFLGLSQYDLALKTKIPQCTISLLERDYLRPKENVKEAIAKVLNCTADELFSKEDSRC